VTRLSQEIAPAYREPVNLSANAPISGATPQIALNGAGRLVSVVRVLLEHPQKYPINLLGEAV
jgi:hypothetical protein